MNVRIKEHNVFSIKKKKTSCFSVFYNVFLFINLVVQRKYTQNKDLAIF